MKTNATRCILNTFEWEYSKKIWLSLVLSLLIINPFSPKMEACSTFFLQNGNHIICGRNFDYSYAKYLIFVNRRNVTKTALQYSSEVVDLPAIWTSKYGSITFNMDGRDVPTDGMNEAGLVVTSLILLGSEYTNTPGLPSVSIDQLGQYLLDNFATVEEVIAGCLGVNVRYNPHDYWRLHMLVTDSTGANVAIEFIDGQLVATTGDDLVKNVLTNSSFELSMEYYNSERNPNLPATASLSRFCTAVDMVDAYQNQNIYDYAYSIMDAVAQSHTQRKIIYDISNMRVYLKTKSNVQLRYFDMNTFDFSCQSETLVYGETLADLGNIREKFIPYTTEINKNSAKMGWNFLGMTYTEDELDEFAQYPNTFECVAADAGENQVLCNNYCSIEGSSATYYTGYWTIISGYAQFDNSLERITTVRDLAHGENILRWTLTGDLGTFYDEMVITNNKVTANAGNDVQVCENEYILNGNEPTNEETGCWEIVSGEGKIEQSSNHNSKVTGLSAGTNEFKWTLTRESCQSADILIVSNNSVTARADIDKEVCSDESTLSAEDPFPHTGSWKIIEGNAHIETPGSNISDVDNLVSGDNMFIWTVSEPGGCADTDTLIVSNNSVIARADIDKEVCSDESTLSAEDPFPHTGSWKIIEGNAQIETPGSNISDVENLGTGDNMFIWTVSEPGGCADTDTLIVTNNKVTAFAGDDQNITVDATYLSANEAIIGSGQWYVLEGNAVFSGANLFNTYVSNLNEGVNKFIWEVTNLACSDKDTVEINYSIESSIGQIDKNANSIKVFPNPSNQFINVELENEGFRTVELIILNSFGQVTRNYTYSVNIELTKQKINIGDLPKGAYYIVVCTDKYTKAARFVKL